MATSPHPGQARGTHTGVCGAQAQHRARAQRRASRWRRGDTERLSDRRSPSQLPFAVRPECHQAYRGHLRLRPTCPLLPGPSPAPHGASVLGVPTPAPRVPALSQTHCSAHGPRRSPPGNDEGRASAPPGGSAASTMGPPMTGGKCHSRPRGYMRVPNRPHSSASLGAGHPSGMLCQGRAPPVPSSFPWETLPASSPHP